MALAMEGLTMDPSVLLTREEREVEVSPIGQKLLDAFHAHERGQHKAAAGHAVDAVNLMAAEHGISCGAGL